MLNSHLTLLYGWNSRYIKVRSTTIDFHYMSVVCMSVTAERFVYAIYNGTRCLVLTAI